MLTAHPTEVARRTLVQKHNRIAAALASHDRADLTVPERDDLIDALRREIAAAWQTGDVRQQRPSPLDEVRSGLIVFEQSLWDALPRFVRGVDRALRASTGQGLPIDAAPIRFGSWIGGDRDGNPHVTPRVTREACLLSRWAAADLYLQELDTLRDELSLESAIPELRAQVGDAREPYRELLRTVRSRMLATRQWVEASLRSDEDIAPGPDAYVESTEFTAALELCHRSLEETGQGLIGAGRLTDLLRRAAAFSLTLARIDIRQDASRHTDALATVTSALGLGSYADWDEAARLEFLTRELNGRRPSDSGRSGDHAGGARRPRYVPADRAHARRIARRLRDHDDARCLGRARRGAAAERGTRHRAAGRRAAVRDRARSAERRRRSWMTCSACRGTASGPAGDCR